MEEQGDDRTDGIWYQVLISSVLLLFFAKKWTTTRQVSPLAAVRQHVQQ